MQKKLYKDPNRKMVSGVLAGLSDYLNVDVTIVRVLYAILSFVTTAFPGILLYIILAIVMPNKSDVENQNKNFSNNNNSYNHKQNNQSKNNQNNAYHDVEYKENPNPNDINYDDSSRSKGGSYSPQDRNNG